MAEEEVVKTLQLIMAQMEAQQQALVKLTEVLDQYLKDPVRVDVANAPKVSLTENNSVGISPENNHVFVGNFPEFRDRNAPGVEPFQVEVEVMSNTFQPKETPIDVPSGKRLVVVFITLTTDLSHVFLRTIANGMNVNHLVSRGSMVVHIFADPGRSVFLRIEPQPGESPALGAPGFKAKIGVSGYLVSA